MFYYIDVEVAGGLGDNTIANTNVHPPEVSKLHYQFDGWLGDDILESFPCYIVTDKLKDLLESAKLSGFQFADVEISFSEQFFSNSLGNKLPNFHWLKIFGVAGQEDIGISKDFRLVVSKKSLEVLQQCVLEQADVEDY